MITLVRAELLKLRTTRLWLVLLVVGVAVVGLIVVAVLASSPDGSRGSGPARPEDGRRSSDVAHIGGIAATLALVLGATMTTSEYRYGTAGITYLATPRRARVVTAKMLAAVPVGALFGLIGASVPLLVALAWFAVKGNTVPLDHTVPLEILQIGLQALFGAVMGVAVGAVLRNQVAAIVGLLVWVLVVESILSSLIPVTAKWLPFSGAAGAFSSQASDRLFARPEAGLLMAAYVVLGWAAAVWFERHRDV